MKKTLLGMFVALFVAIISVSNVQAMTNSELINYACGTFNVAGQKAQLPENYQQLVKSYLSDHPVSDSDANKIKAKIDAAVSVMDKAGVVDVTKLSSSEKKQILSLAEESAAIAGAKITYEKSASGAPEITVYVDGSSTPYKKINSSVLKLVQTGSNNVGYALIVTSICVVACGIAMYRKNANA